MCRFSLSKIDQDLSRQVQSPDAESRILILGSKLPEELIPKISSWENARSWLDHVYAYREEADQLLYPLIEDYQSNPDEIGNAILLYMFWTPLTSIFRFRRKLDSPSALFSEIHWMFLEVLNRLDTESRPQRIGQKILNDTNRGVRDRYIPKSKSPVRLFIDEEEEAARQNGLGAWCLQHGVIEYGFDRQKAISRLKSLARQGHISKSDFQMILGCHLYGRSIDEMASQLGVSYGVAKKRRQRAEKKLQKNAPHLSPNHLDSPLYQVERSSRKEASDGSELRVPQNRK